MSLLAVWFLAASLHAQAPQTTESGKTITVIPNAVTLPTVVRDRKGELVTGLTLGDFKLSTATRTGDFSPSTLSSVKAGGDVLLNLGLIVDVSRSAQSLLPEERAAAETFLTKTLQPAAAGRPADAAFVLHFAKQIELLQDVTSDPAQLQKAIKLVGTDSSNFHTADEGDTRDSEGRTEHHGGVALYDAVYLAADQLTAKLPGRKVLVVFTDGVDVGSKEQLTEAIEAAQRANTAIYAVYFKAKPQPGQDNGYPRAGRAPGNNPYPGGGYPGGGYPGRYPGGGYPGGSNPGSNPNDPNSPNNPNDPSKPRTTPTRKPSVDGRQVLERICGETGGAVFEVTKKDTIDDILGRINGDLKAEYLLSFTPSDAAAREGYHRIDLEMTGENAKKKLDVQVRAGYYVTDSK